MSLYNYELNTKIKIFNQLYVGLRDQAKQRISEGDQK